MIKVIIFDFDGVIVESLDVKKRAFAELFKDKGKEIVQRVVDYHLQNGGVSRYDKFRYIYTEILKQPLPQREYERLCDNFAALVFDGVVASSYVSGALEFLQGNGSYRIFVASATPSEELHRICESRGIINFFERIFGAPTTKSEAVNTILNLTGAFPEESVFIGDALSDFEAATINGVTFIARIHDNEELFNDKRCLKVNDLHELGHMLTQMDLIH